MKKKLQYSYNVTMHRRDQHAARRSQDVKRVVSSKVTKAPHRGPRARSGGVVAMDVD